MNDLPGSWVRSHIDALATDSEEDEYVPARKAKTRHRTAEAKRKARAASRQKSKKDLPVIPGRTPAEVMTVKAATQRSYLLLLRAIVTFMFGLSSQVLLPHKSISQVKALRALRGIQSDAIIDDLPAQFIDRTYWEGEEGGLGRKLLAALGWFLSRFQKEGEGRLPRDIRASRGTARRSPGVTRLPLPEQSVYALGMVLAFLGMKEGDGILPSFALMLCFHLYPRPGELYRLRWRHITLPNPSTPRSAAVVLHPTEEERASKVREFD
jgi:hypothetical protein